MNVLVPEPGGLTWQEWSAAFSGYNTSVSFIPQPMPEVDWKTWAREVRQVPSFEGYNLPEPEDYDTWQEWAQWLALALVGAL